MEEGLSLIVIDNTNLQAWEAHPYVLLAQEFGYKYVDCSLSVFSCRLVNSVEIREPTTAWCRDAEELARKSSHTVPVEAVRTMLSKW
jgi:hypothetical protein